MRTLRENRASILVIVMISIIFTAAALVAFMDKASNELLVASHIKVGARLREEAYSALENSLAVIDEFYEASSKTLHSPTEGWGNPLDASKISFVAYTPAAGHTVDVAVTDESGKLSLMHTDAAVQLALYEAWGLSQDDAQKMVDELMMWMQLNRNYVPVIAGTPDYEQDTAPYDAPLRPMRTYDELAAIDFVKDTLYDADGHRNDLWWKFYNDFSLFNYTTPNINSAPPDVLQALGLFDPTQQGNIAAFLAGQGDFVNPARVQALGGQWFTSVNEIKNVAGGQGNASKFGYTVQAMRINITVHEGKSQFRLSAVVSLQGGAKTVQTTATDGKKGTSSSASGQTGESAQTNTITANTGPKATPTSAQTSAATAGTVNLQYPFTILEITENDQILTPPPPPPPPTA